MREYFTLNLTDFPTWDILGLLPLWVKLKFLLKNFQLKSKSWEWKNLLILFWASWKSSLFIHLTTSVPNRNFFPTLSNLSLPFVIYFRLTFQRDGFLSIFLGNVGSNLWALNYTHQLLTSQLGYVPLRSFSSK